MQDMRRLACLFLEFKRQFAAGHVEEPTSAADILVRSKFEILRTAVCLCILRMICRVFRHDHGRLCPLRLGLDYRWVDIVALC